MNVTVKDIMDLGPCDDYTEERVTELWDGREALSFEEIRELDIPIEDIGWAILSILSSRHPKLAEKIARRIRGALASLAEEKCELGFPMGQQAILDSLAIGGS